MGTAWATIGVPGALGIGQRICQILRKYRACRFRGMSFDLPMKPDRAGRKPAAAKIFRGATARWLEPNSEIVEGGM